MRTRLKNATYRRDPWIPFKCAPRTDGRSEYRIHAYGNRQNGNGETIFTVAAVMPSFHAESRPWVHDYQPDEVESNAHLIAASPELLSAVEVAYEFLINPHKFNPLSVEQQYEAAIRKARGEL